MQIFMPQPSRRVNVNHVEVVLPDDAVQVHVDEVLPGRSAPMPQQHALYVGQFQRPLEQRIGGQVHLANRQVIRGTPVGVHFLQQLRRE